MTLICKICKRECKNRLSLTNHIHRGHKLKLKEYYDIFFKTLTEDICRNSVCGGKTSFRNLFYGYSQYCSIKCASSDFTTKLKKVNTSLKNYRVINPMKAVKVVKKLEHTVIERYGVKNPMQNEEFKEKGRQTNLERYGFDYPMKSVEVKEKVDKTMLEKYKTKRIAQTEWWIDYMKNGQAAYMNSKNKNPSWPQTKTYTKVKVFCEDAVLNYLLKLSNKKWCCLDIAIPSLKIDIEYDGSRWHEGREEFDKERDGEVIKQGWKVLRYRDHIPTLQQLRNDINKLLGK